MSNELSLKCVVKKCQQTLEKDSVARRISHHQTNSLLATKFAIHSYRIDYMYLYYGVATTSRLLIMIGLFCKRALSKTRYSAKETYNVKEPTNRSHPTCMYLHTYLCITIYSSYMPYMLCITIYNSYISYYITWYI